MRFIFIAASLPALVGSLLIMTRADAGRVLVVQQMFVAIIAFGVCVLAVWRTRTSTSRRLPAWIVSTALVALVLTFVDHSSEGPHRWIDLGGFRLYAAALVLPSALFALANAISTSDAERAWPLPIAIGIAASLSLQPDASQVTAFSIASAIALLIAHLRLIVKLISLCALIACVSWAWFQPDPLVPVPYVEGVLDVAWTAGPVAFAAALLAMALPPVALAWKGWTTRSVELLVVAVYYVAIQCFAGLQLTPMPLLGFGVGPILGYFLLVYFAAKTSRSRQAIALT